TCFVAVAAGRLGDEERAARAWSAVRERVAELEAARPTTDYFATSLPAMLLFVTDPADVVHHELADLRALLEHRA
ncbi:hypothetical protein, partial [Actinotalea sp. C106]|uniref:hypothetical protein n=1 Tax=Actinotalea sp. C106 TaxID=2908644 RepID=UPI002028B19F